MGDQEKGFETKGQELSKPIFVGLKEIQTLDVKEFLKKHRFYPLESGEFTLLTKVISKPYIWLYTFFIYTFGLLWPLFKKYINVVK